MEVTLLLDSGHMLFIEFPPHCQRELENSLELGIKEGGFWDPCLISDTCTATLSDGTVMKRVNMSRVLGVI